MNTFWTTALSFPAPMAGITTPSPFREEAECRDEELAPDEEQRHPHGQAAHHGIR